MGVVDGDVHLAARPYSDAARLTRQGPLAQVCASPTVADDEAVACGAGARRFQRGAPGLDGFDRLPGRRGQQQDQGYQSIE
ncbi:MAG: hypothetical protein KKD28_06510 [Chloroflexi bacterium]|nr:hypothetical protein [Chloroflexota bacterium]